MFRHVIVPALDPAQPASFSRKIVQSVIRNAWDPDVSRWPRPATATGLSMRCVLRSARRDTLDTAKPARSDRRLARNPRPRGLSQ